MTKRLAITMTAYRRPEYTRLALLALRDAVGIAGVAGIECVFFPQLEPSQPVVHSCFDQVDVGCHTLPEVNPHRLGLNMNTRAALHRARNARLDPIGHLHIEDDTVLSPDALLYYAWALERFAADKSVFTVAGYNKPDHEPRPNQSHECRRRDWFTCWGWATWHDRLGNILVNWCTKNPKSFAWHVNRETRRGRCEVHPVLSRVQNIGYELGENGRTAEWYEANHRTPWVAGVGEVGAGEFHLRRDRHQQKDECNVE